MRLILPTGLKYRHVPYVVTHACGTPLVALCRWPLVHRHWPHFLEGLAVTFPSVALSHVMRRWAKQGRTGIMRHLKHLIGIND